VVRADGAATRMGAQSEVRGASAVAGFFNGRAQGAGAALVDGAAGAAWVVRGRPRVVFRFTIAGEKVVPMDLTG
jgi:hypothetical protein